MTELSFLIELLLDDQLPKPIKEKVAARIKDVEQGLSSPQRGTIIGNPYQPGATLTYVPPANPKTTQAPSTLALMAKHGDIVPPPVMPPIPEPMPVVQVAQTPATAAAINSRNTAISESIAGKVDKHTGRPKKW